MLKLATRISSTIFVILYSFLGEEVKDVFMQSGLPQPLLAHVW
jgi:hypothetical protein